jgi:hypothetical protein
MNKDQFCDPSTRITRTKPELTPKSGSTRFGSSFRVISWFLCCADPHQIANQF